NIYRKLSSYCSDRKALSPGSMPDLKNVVERLHTPFRHGIDDFLDRTGVGLSNPRLYSRTLSGTDKRARRIERNGRDTGVEPFHFRGIQVLLDIREIEGGELRVMAFEIIANRTDCLGAGKIPNQRNYPVLQLHFAHRLVVL